MIGFAVDRARCGDAGTTPARTVSGACVFGALACGIAGATASLAALRRGRPRRTPLALLCVCLALLPGAAALGVWWLDKALTICFVR